MTNFLFALISCWLISCGLPCLAAAQEAKQTSVEKISSPSQQEETYVPNDIITSTEAPATSPQETKAESSSVDAADTTKSTSDINVSKTSSGSETNTNTIVPTESSMIPSPESASDNANNVPLPVDPNAGNMTGVAGEETSPVNSTESIEKKKHEIKVRYNEVRTQVEKEEAVGALRQAAEKETTTEGERQTLKAYYELLFKRMKQIDPALTERCDMMQGAYLRRVEQAGAEPTIPLHLLLGADKKSTNADQGAPPPTKGKSHKKTSTSNASQ